MTAPPEASGGVPRQPRLASWRCRTAIVRPPRCRSSSPRRARAQGRVARARAHPSPRAARTKCRACSTLLETGAADRVGLTDEELCLAVSVHRAEAPRPHGPRRARPARSWGRGGPRSALRADPAGRSGRAPRDSGERSTSRGAIHNNCSGKHAGFLALTRFVGADPASYLDFDSPGQTLVRAALADMTDRTPEELGVAVDGCSAPTFRTPLSALALGFARVTNPDGLALERRAAAERIQRAVAAHPGHLAGAHRRLCTAIVRASGARGSSRRSAPRRHLRRRRAGRGRGPRREDGRRRAARAPRRRRRAAPARASNSSTTRVRRAASSATARAVLRNCGARGGAGRGRVKRPCRSVLVGAIARRTRRAAQQDRRGPRARAARPGRGARARGRHGRPRRGALVPDRRRRLGPRSSLPSTRRTAQAAPARRRFRPSRAARWAGREPAPRRAAIRAASREGLTALDAR